MHRGLYAVKQKEPMRHRGSSSELRQASGKIKRIPQAEWVQHILEFSQAHGSKVFLKNNLAPYFAGDLVQDFPFSYPPKNLG